MNLTSHLRRLVRAALLHPKLTGQAFIALALWLYCGPALWKSITGWRTAFGGVFVILGLALIMLAGYQIGLLIRRLRDWSLKS